MKKNIGNIIFFCFCGLLFFILFCQVGLLPFRFTYLLSGSMRPTYEPGDLAFVFVGNNLAVKPGDVVLFRSALGPTIHRVAAVENGLITTQGDANNAPDAGQIQRVDGKVLFALPRVGYAIDFFQSGMRSVAKLIQGT